MSNVAEMGKSGEIARLRFCRNANSKDKTKPENGSMDFTVMINPESISRQMTMSATENKSAKSKSKGDVRNCEPETISFTFYLDKTNVVPDDDPKHVNQSVDDMINAFLEVVYKASDGSPVQALAIMYGEQCWIVRTNNITVEHNLFSRKGTTLRAKITCSFSTITDDSTPKKTSTPTKTTPKPTNTCECVCAPISCEDARSNNQNSLYISADANFSTSSGQEIKK